MARNIYLQLDTFCPPEKDLGVPSNEYAATGQFGKLIIILASSKLGKSTVSPNTLSTIKILTPSILSLASGIISHGIMSFFLWQQLAKLAKTRKTVSLNKAPASRSTVNDRAGLQCFTVYTQGPAWSPMRDAQSGQWPHQRNRC